MSRSFYKLHMIRALNLLFSKLKSIFFYRQKSRKIRYILLNNIITVLNRYKLGNDPVLWTWLDFSYRNENTHVTMVKTVSLRFHFMSSMTLKNFRSPDEMERMLLHMGNNCARLREVHLFNCALRSETLVRLGEMCPNITSLSLICCDENYRKNHYMWSYMRDCSFGGIYIQVKFGGCGSLNFF